MVTNVEEEEEEEEEEVEEEEGDNSTSDVVGHSTYSGTVRLASKKLQK